jgi:hypothetical protein
VDEWARWYARLLLEPDWSTAAGFAAWVGAWWLLAAIGTPVAVVLGVAVDIAAGWMIRAWPTWWDRIARRHAPRR